MRLSLYSTLHGLLGATRGRKDCKNGRWGFISASLPQDHGHPDFLRNQASVSGDSTSWESLPGVSTPHSHITPLHKVAWVLPAQPLDPGLPAHVSQTIGNSATRNRDPLGQIQCNQLTAKPRTQLGALARGLASFAGWRSTGSLPFLPQISLRNHLPTGQEGAQPCHSSGRQATGGPDSTVTCVGKARAGSPVSSGTKTGV